MGVLSVEPCTPHGGRRHPRANAFCVSESLFLVGYAVDLSMARVWQTPFPGTHKNTKFTLLYRLSAGEFDGPRRGGRKGGGALGISASESQQYNRCTQWVNAG